MSCDVNDYIEYACMALYFIGPRKFTRLSYPITVVWHRNMEKRFKKKL
jgi:hypothetical protein